MTTEFVLATHRSEKLDGGPVPAFNCSGMYRGYVNPDGIVYTAIYDKPYRSA